VSDEGTPRTLVGTPVVMGEAAPDFSCRVYDPETAALDPFGLADTPPDTVRVFSVVPSLDTPVCALQTTRFDADVAAMGGGVAAYTVSVDTPYAMDRFCRSHAVGTLVSLSDYRPERSFGHA
jgi:thioredoxin-dependent peroxiredoxin